MPNTRRAATLGPGRRRSLPIALIVWAIVIGGCASTPWMPEDVGALAAEHDLATADLQLYLDGYAEGYDDGLSRNAGVFAGTGHGNVPGPRGAGWQLGHEDAVAGYSLRDPDELAARLARQSR